MYNLRARLPFSMLSLSASVVGALVVVYIGLIAMIMSFAASTVEYAQSARNDEAVVAALEAQYLSGVTRITNADYAALGYAKPAAIVFVRGEGGTALR